MTSLPRLPRLAEHNRFMGAHLHGPVGVLCDICGTEMHVDSSRTAGRAHTDPPSVPVHCPGCRYRGYKVALSQSRVETLIAAAGESPTEPEPVQ